MTKSKWVADIKYRNCPNCEKDNYVVVSRKMKDDINLTTVICKNCSLVYTNPVPAEELYNNFYIEAYNNYYIHQEKFTPSLKGIPVYAEKILKIICEYLPDTNSQILEIGSGSGSLLYYLTKQYPNSIGIEPGSNSDYAKKNFNLNIIYDFFEKHDFGDQKFDMIIMLHVLEHFYDINLAVSKCRVLLKENGYLFIEVPNILKPFKSPDRYFLRYVHLINFSPYTIKAFLAKHGFETTWMDSHGTHGAVPKNIRLVAKKVDNKIKIPLPEHENYKSVIKTLRQKRALWYLWGWPYFGIHSLLRKTRSRLAKSKAGLIIKKLIRKNSF